jgi:diketogulonate reductase-like aldo/keto reductase
VTGLPDFIYGTAWKEDRTQVLTELALEVGFRAIDTANQRRHYFEAGVGKAIQTVLQAGTLKREDLFLQTKFTSLGGQDHRLPYDPSADLATQVRQSMESSLEHLGTDYVDSYVLHGPASAHGWTRDDAEAWEAMIALREGGRARRLGVSNVSLRHLEQLCAAGPEPPAFVQNRCYARTGWDRSVRAFCRSRKIVYQGFSLLTANPEIVGHPALIELASRLRATPEQIVFRFSQQAGMLPLTGTTDRRHMEEDLASRSLALSEGDVRAIEPLSG